VTAVPRGISLSLQFDGRNAGCVCAGTSWRDLLPLATLKVGCRSTAANGERVVSLGKVSSPLPWARFRRTPRLSGWVGIEGVLGSRRQRSGWLDELSVFAKTCSVDESTRKWGLRAMSRRGSGGATGEQTDPQRYTGYQNLNRNKVPLAT